MMLGAFAQYICALEFAPKLLDELPPFTATCASLKNPLYNEFFADTQCQQKERKSMLMITDFNNVCLIIGLAASLITIISGIRTFVFYIYKKLDNGKSSDKNQEVLLSASFFIANSFLRSILIVCQIKCMITKNLPNFISSAINIFFFYSIQLSRNERDFYYVTMCNNPYSCCRLWLYTSQGQSQNIFTLCLYPLYLFSCFFSFLLSLFNEFWQQIHL